ncbi:hypothetical protein PPACK8108_LOCUS23993 [Phakopsora pachyrhizi]|uniref:Uncharacterized protein n=1 Tax=Phakopsora pachyrhizi TaxID=170000 RepID=A0AAV0BPI8_PHAPC|nr:hypothetical protein PPACK8108_LOCUS23993 [Phakopsora pachyrhizi]
MPSSDVFLKPDWVNFEALESAVWLNARSAETVALVLGPFAELPLSAYTDLGYVVEEVCELMWSIKQSFTASNLLQNVDPMLSNAFEIAYEELFTVVLRNPSVNYQPAPEGQNFIEGTGIKKLTKFFNNCMLGLLILFSSEYPNVDIKLTKNATESKTRFEQQAPEKNKSLNFFSGEALYCLSNFFLLGLRAIFTANTIDHRKQSRWQSLARLEVTKMGLHWGPFGNIQVTFLDIASILTWKEFIGPHIMDLQFSIDFQLIVNSNVNNEKEICK